MSLIIHKLKSFRFQTVHAFDVAVVLTILIVLGIFLYNRFSKKTIWIDARISVSDDSLWWKGEQPPLWYLDGLKEGMVSYNSFGEVTAEITNLQVFPVGGPYSVGYVDVKLKVAYDQNRQLYLYNFRPLEKGKPIDLTFGSNNVYGLIMSLGEQQDQAVTKKIRVQMKQLEKSLADAYQVGMEMKDTNNVVLARIDAITVSESKLKPVTFIDSALFYDDIQRKDVLMDLTITATEGIDNTYHFADGAAIKIGNIIWFHFPTVVAQATVVDILE